MRSKWKRLTLAIITLGHMGLHGVDVVVSSCDKTECCLGVCLEPYEVIYKDSLRIFVDGQSCKFHVLAEPVEEYVAPLKLHKKIYKQPMAIKVDHEPLRPGACLYLSCFVIEQEESIVPVIKKLCLKKIAVVRPLGEVLKPVRHLIKKRILSLLHPRLWVLLFLVLLLIGFVLVNVLSALDVGVITFLLGWFFVVGRIIPLVVLQSFLAVWLVLAGVYFFSNYGETPLVLRRTRMVLGFVCVLGIVPLLVEVCLEIILG